MPINCCPHYSKYNLFLFRDSWAAESTSTAEISINNAYRNFVL
jgi:hypothetical protein